MYELVIEPGRSERQYWRDLWRYRELFYTLVWRDASVRYNQTIIRIAGSLIQPSSDISSSPTGTTTQVAEVFANRLAAKG